MQNMLPRILVALLFFLLSTALTNSDDTLETILENFERYNAKYPQEKVHLHFDKDYYSIGDDIWFKAYVVNSEKNELSLLSKVLYVDVLDELDSVRKTVVLPLENGLAAGDVNLSDSLFEAGNYHIRAYTKWMLNFDNSYFFEKRLSIGDAVNAEADFTFKPIGGKQALSTSVLFKGVSNESLTGDTVSYAFIHQGKNISIGKSVIDENGKIQIVSSLKPGVIHDSLVLATTLMKNGTQKSVHRFKVLNTLSENDVQFFPEGGSLVNGLRSKVGIKAVGNDGLGLSVKGYIEDEDGKRQTDVSTGFAGMGVFALQPQAGKTYAAVIRFPDGSQRRFSLPASQNSGYVLGINHIGNDSLAISVSATKDLTSGQEVILIAQNNGSVQYLAKIKVDKTINTSFLSAKRFQSGIVQLTLFTADYTPVAERLAFIHPRNNFKVAINGDKPTYNKRQQVNAEIVVLNAAGEPVTGSFSVAVTDQDKVVSSEDDEMTILSNLLLTSELKGYIEKPNYYFTNVTQEKIHQLDALMLTQGWRRFKWDDIKAGIFPQIKYPAEDGLSISGNITTTGGKPVPNAKVTLFGSSKTGPIFADTTADLNGRFIFNKLDFADSTRFVVKAKTANDSNNVQVILDKAHFTLNKNSDGKSIYYTFAPAFLNYLKYTQKRFKDMYKQQNISKSIKLKEVRINDKLPPKIYRSEFPSDIRADLTLTPDKLQSAGHISALLRGQVAVTVMFDKVWGERRGDQGQMLILLDGKVMNSLDGISPMALAGIQILKGSNITESLGMMVGGRYNRVEKREKMSERSAYYGIIYLTTERRATKYNSSQQANVSYTTPKGYSITREFYSPVYQIPNEKNQVYDMRSTIYWNPNVITGNDGKASFSYFTADDPGKYRIVIEGLDLKGNLIRQIECITVK